MGYALRSEQRYTGMRPGETEPHKLMSTRRFRASLSPRPRPQKTLFNVDVAGLTIRLESTDPHLPGPVIDSLSRISDLAEFQADWNSYGALPLNASVVEPAIYLIVATFPICMQPEISLNPSGGLNLFWHRDAKELEVDLYPDGSCDYTYEDSEAGEERSPEQRVSFVVVQELVGELFR